jgi:hypothetical protein
MPKCVHDVLDPYTYSNPMAHTRLDLAHKPLDEAIFAAYGWKPDLSNEEILEKLLALNLGRSQSK